MRKRRCSLAQKGGLAERQARFREEARHRALALMAAVPQRGLFDWYPDPEHGRELQALYQGSSLFLQEPPEGLNEEWRRQLWQQLQLQCPQAARAVPALTGGHGVKLLARLVRGEAYAGAVLHCLCGQMLSLCHRVIPRRTPPSSPTPGGDMTLLPERRPRQRNHDSFTLPPGLESLTDEPLYIVVAEWCLQQGGWKSRNDIALAFRISPQRATYQLSYLTRRPEIIRCEVRQVRTPGSPNNHYEVRVHEVDLARLHARPAAVQSRESQVRGARRSRVGNADQSIRNSLKQLWPVRAKGDAE